MDFKIKATGFCPVAFCVYGGAGIQECEINDMRTLELSQIVLSQFSNPAAIFYIGLKPFFFTLALRSLQTSIIKLRIGNPHGITLYSPGRV
jgi:hypothetical protein